MLAYIGRMSVRLVNTQRAMGQLMGVGMFRMGLWIGWDCGSGGCNFYGAPGCIAVGSGGVGDMKI